MLQTTATHRHIPVESPPKCSHSPEERLRSANVLYQKRTVVLPTPSGTLSGLLAKDVGGYGPPGQHCHSAQREREDVEDEAVVDQLVRGSLRRDGPGEQDGESHRAGETAEALRGVVQPAELSPQGGGDDAR